MTVASEIQRLKQAKDSIKESINNKGVAVSDSDKLSDYAVLIDSIPTSSGKFETTFTPSNSPDTYSIQVDKKYSNAIIYKTNKNLGYTERKLLACVILENTVIAMIFTSSAGTAFAGNLLTSNSNFSVTFNDNDITIYSNPNNYGSFANEEYKCVAW